MRALPLSLTVALAATSAPAITPESSQAVILAVRSGEVIGAASACGMPDQELVEAGRQVIGRVRDLATNEGELARARRAPEQAVARGAEGRHGRAARPA